MSDRARTWLIAVAIFLLTAVLFGGAVQNGFVNYDDDVYVYANPAISHGLTFSGLVRAFAEPHARNWHPLTTLSHMIDCQVFGLSPAGPHVINALLHALAAALLFVVLQAMTASTWRAAFVAAVFAIHPLRVESVAWISERKDVLSALLFMCALAGYVRYVRAPDFRRMLPVIALFVAGLMAKPMLVSLPIVLVLLDFWPLQRLGASVARGRNTTSLGGAVLEKLPLFALAAASCAVTFWAARSGNVALPAVPLVERLSNAALSCFVYIGQLFRPTSLAVFYPAPIAPPSLVLIGATSAFLLVITIVVFLARRRAPYLFVGWLWYLIMLTPVIGIVQIGLQSHADRYTYLPQVGLLIAISWGAVDLMRRLRALPLAIPASLFLLGVLGWLTWDQVRFWRDSETLWKHAVAVTQDNDTALFNLGAAFERRGDLDAAVTNYRSALSVLEQRPGPRYDVSRALVHNNLGNVAAARRESDEALREYDQSIALRPDFADAHVNLGQLRGQLGDWNAALAEFDNAARAQPRDADAYHRAGIALMRLGRIDDAIARYKSALVVEPQFSAAELDLGNALLEQGHFDEAFAHYQKAVQIDPDNADAHFNYARMLFQQRRVEDAIGEYERVVALQPGDPQAHLALGNALAAAGSERRAADELEKALKLAPDSPSALNNLAWLLATATDSTVRNPARAIELAEKAGQQAPQPNALIYHTLAAAYSAAGKTADAITADEGAQKLAEEGGDTALAEAVKKELEDYRKTKPGAPTP